MHVKLRIDHLLRFVAREELEKHSCVVFMVWETKALIWLQDYLVFIYQGDLVFVVGACVKNLLVW